MTFAEWWPIYNSVFGKTIKPMTFEEFGSVEESWASDGNT